MTGYLAQRLAGTVPVLLLISLLVFLLIHAAPGDPTLLLLGEETNTAEIAKAKERWGLDRPLYIQYFKFVASALTGEFGKSFKYAEPVANVIKTRLPYEKSCFLLDSLETPYQFVSIRMIWPFCIWSASTPLAERFPSLLKAFQE